MDEMLNFPMEEEMKERIIDVLKTLTVYVDGVRSAASFITHPSMIPAIEAIADLSQVMEEFVEQVSEYPPTQAHAYEFLFILSDHMPNITKADSILHRLGVAILTDHGKRVSEYLSSLCKF